jgi:hypothetical protein
MANYDQGQVLPSAIGTAITAAYNANTTSAALYGAAITQIDVFLLCNTAGASPITTVTVKLQAQDRDGVWYDVTSKRQDTQAESVEHAFALGAAPQVDRPLMITCRDARGAFAVRLRAKADAIGVAGDTITASVTFS